MRIPELGFDSSRAISNIKQAFCQDACLFLGAETCLCDQKKMLKIVAGVCIITIFNACI
jgi:hypothetical protein